MNWNEILDAMRTKHVAARRKNWSGNKYILYFPWSYADCKTYNEYGLKDKGIIVVVPHLLIHTKENTLGYYATTQCDMLADDWEIVE